MKSERVYTVIYKKLSRYLIVNIAFRLRLLILS